MSARRIPRGREIWWPGLGLSLLITGVLVYGIWALAIATAALVDTWGMR